MLRFYEFQNGIIKIGNLSIKEVDTFELRNQFAFVSQEPIIFANTVFENIRFGRPNASIDEVETAAKNAASHEFIMNLPNGYDTFVGERALSPTKVS